MAGFLQYFDQQAHALREEIKAGLGAVNPKRIELKEAFDSLGDKSWFKNLDPDSQLEAASEFMARANKPAPPKSAGSPGGRGVPRKSREVKKNPFDELPEGVRNAYRSLAGLDDGDKKTLMLGGKR